MHASPASLITKAASSQTYYTIRFLVDDGRTEDAYRAYGYCRWLDDTLDAATGSQPERLAFLDRQRALLDRCYRGDPPRDPNAHEQMLVELVGHDPATISGLHLYLRDMMRVMDFDTRRRGTFVSQAQLNDYTRWLAGSVTECIHYFIGHAARTPHDATRYLAVSAAHIAHMLRDTFDDAQVGYYNAPRELLEGSHIGPLDVHTEAYRGWVKSRVELARRYFQAGKDYFARVESLRCRLACYAYIARFEWLLNTIEREGYVLRPQYTERKQAGTALRMIGLTLQSLINSRAAGPAREAPAQAQGKVWRRDL
jgi:hypothetical protein